jgi:phosphoglycolate phosphatase-like HAD superfamily hydrolase
MNDSSIDRILTPADFPLGLKGLVFDIDGVLFDSKVSNMAFYNSVRRAVGLPDISPEEQEFCHMASVTEAFDRIIPEPLRRKAMDACMDINYMRDILPLIAPEPHVTDLLDLLARHGFGRGIFTNRSTLVEDVLAYFHLDKLFDPLKTAGNCPPKPSPEGLLQILEEWGAKPSQIAFVGDSRVDQMAAEAAGVPFWAFRGPDLRADLHTTGFLALIRSVTPLVEGG